MKRIIKSVDENDRPSALDFIETVFSEYASTEEGQAVRKLTEEIRAKEYYIPELELIMMDGENNIIGYALFSRFPLEGKYKNELLMLGPVAVKTELQRQHISKELIEYGFSKAKNMGFSAVLVEGRPVDYCSRGFVPSHNYGIVAGPTVQLSDVRELMVKQLVDNALKHITGIVDYSFYKALTE